LKKEVFYQLSFKDAFALVETGHPLDAFWTRKAFEKKGTLFVEMEYKGLKVISSIQKIETFKRSLDCACCETKGEAFQIVRHGNDPNISLDLYGRNLYGDFTLMTQDHIFQERMVVEMNLRTFKQCVINATNSKVIMLYQSMS